MHSESTSRSSGADALWPQRDARQPDVAPLLRAARFVHDAAYAESGRRNTCIFSSAALTDILVALGYTATMVRVETTVFASPAHQRRLKQRWGGATTLGSFGDGSRRPAAKPGMWSGHVAVLVTAGPGFTQPVLCDPTIDQTGFVRGPVAVRVPADWWTPGGRATLQWTSGAFAYVRAHPERKGWLGAPDYRPAQRRAMVEAALEALRKH